MLHGKGVLEATVNYIKTLRVEGNLGCPGHAVSSQGPEAYRARLKLSQGRGCDGTGRSEGGMVGRAGPIVVAFEDRGVREGGMQSSWSWERQCRGPAPLFP